MEKQVKYIMFLIYSQIFEMLFVFSVERIWRKNKEYNYQGERNAKSRADIRRVVHDWQRGCQ